MNVWEIGGEIARTGTATHEHGGELDWFLVSNALRGNWEIEQENDQPFQGHRPIKLTIPGFQDSDLGYRLVNPKKSRPHGAHRGNRGPRGARR